MAETNVLAQLERWLTELARKYDRFFAHDVQVPLPPERERAAMERRLREISRTEGRPSAEQFRLEQLLHRFATYNQLWQRLLREREEARTAGRPEPAPARPAETPNKPAAAPVRDRDDGYEQLFEHYRGALHRAGKPTNIAFDRFKAALEQQRQSAEQRGAVVEGFDVVEEASGVKLRARVRKGKQE